jgi:hypothetical protein
LENRKETSVTTPFGNPSDVLIEGKIGGVDCVLLARYKLTPFTLHHPDYHDQKAIWFSRNALANSCVSYSKSENDETLC